MKSEKGAIVLYVVVASLFIIIAGVASYILVSNRQQTQLKQLEEMQKQYESNLSLEDIYKSYQGGEIIEIDTAEDLSKIGTGENIYKNGKIYNFGENKTYVLNGDIEYTGDYETIANLIKTNKIVMNGNNHKIIVTKADDTVEYYTENSKYYIATNEYGYVAEGLEVFYDAIDNVGTGTHSNTTNIWKNLKGNGYDASLIGFEHNTESGWKNNLLCFDRR